MADLEIKDIPKPATFGHSLQQFEFSGSSLPPPIRRITRLSSSTATTPQSSSTTLSSKSVIKTSPRPLQTFSPKQKRKRQSSSHASTAKYAHLPNLLTDTLVPNLVCVFIGVNPGIRTAALGHPYAHPSNLFWKLLHSSGCTPRRCKPSEYLDLPRLYALGNTNIVARATKDASELSKNEMDEGVEVLEEKCRRWRPEAVCLVGKGIWESVWRVRHERTIRKEEFRYGWQDDAERMGIINPKNGEGGWDGARVFVATTTSGLAAGMKLSEKEEVWRGLGEWVERMRLERGTNVQVGASESGLDLKVV